MALATWENCRADFNRAYVDLLVPDAGPAAWQAFWTALRSGPFAVRLSQKFKSLPLPRTVEWIFDLQEVHDDMVTADVPSGPVTALCCFNYASNRDNAPRLSIDCEQVVGPEAFEAVLVLARYLAGAIGKPVLAVAEILGPDDAFIRVSPDGQAEFVPEGAGRPANPWVDPTFSPEIAPPRLDTPGRHPQGVPVPAHLADWLGPLVWDAKDPYIEGDVVCPCGRAELVFHYPGQTHQPRDLPEPIPCVANGAFVIRAVCPACDGRAVVFDHSVHGLTVFLNAHRRAGEELPPLVPWACSACGGGAHRGRVHFRFLDADDFLEYVAGECALERWGDGMKWFGMKLACCACGHTVDPWAGYED